MLLATFRRAILSSPALCAMAAWAQFDVNAFYTSTVRVGQVWAAINTAVDEVQLRIEVNRGIVTTVATVSYTPSEGVNGSRCANTTCTERVANGVSLDSLETSATLQLRDNSAVTDLQLWIGNCWVRGALQDRGLASAQYESIVRRRRDPALIETWGNGSYHLRIFPNASREQRRIQVAFVTGMEEEQGRFAAWIPVRAGKSSNSISYYDGTGVVRYRRVGRVSVLVSAVDGNSYELSLPGRHPMRLSSRPVEISLQDVETFDSLRVTAEARHCRDCATPWIGAHGATGYFGIKAQLSLGDAIFEPEPEERLIVLDVDNHIDPKSLDYARKYALLCLKAYGQAPFRANLGFSGGKIGASYYGNVRFAFPSAVTMDEGALLRAVEALRAYRGSAGADYVAAFTALQRERGSASPKAALIFLSDENPDNFGTDYSIYRDTAAWRRHNEAQQRRADDALNLLREANLVLFGFWNSYRLYEPARKTGGYQLGSLAAYYSRPYYYTGYATDGIVDTASSSPIAWLPRLFGLGRNVWDDPVDLQVETESRGLHDLVVLRENPYSWWYPRMAPVISLQPSTLNDAAMVRSPLAKQSDVAYYPYPSRDTLTLRISGQYDASVTADFRVTGIWCGLRFEHAIQASLPSFQRVGNDGPSLWAYQQGETWGRDGLPDDIRAIQQLGRDYHVVNRQISLLALEPGMALWDSLPGAQNTAANGAIALSTPTAGMTLVDNMTVSRSYQPYYLDLDNLTLEDLLSDRFGSSDPRLIAVSRPELKVRIDGQRVAFSLNGFSDVPVRLEILDLAGRKVASLPATRQGEGWSASWDATGRRGGFYAVARQGKTMSTRRFAVVR